MVKEVRAQHLFIRGFVEGVSCELVVDTGCSTTIASKAVIEAVPKVMQPALGFCAVNILMADGTLKLVLYEACVAIKIDWVVVEQDALVAEILDPVLSGLDFLRDHDKTLKIGKEELLLKGERVALVSRKAAVLSACQVALSENVGILACSRAVVPGIMSAPVDLGNWVALGLPDKSGNQPVLVTRLLFQGGTRHAPVELLNPTHSDIVLRKDTQCG